ncbi:hypothetical protein P9272_08285 [Mesorhizobium sp. WSM4976]|uniref:hypothetical protein n=1 Tax=Mesorhizobium sp. WSM4976 TaxID=3038549 RepID=UPI0024179051|nr:hypothetical protein [Mesorhizobium sp. WSM4976]MDG4893571.1 hypothetical protein [Mesorhizobium sp. WSM4976]
MKKTISILLASTALIAVIGIPAWSAMYGAGQFEGRRDAALGAFQAPGASPVLVSDDDGEDRDHERRLRRGDDDHEGDQEDDDDGGNASGPAPAGSVAPPSNGLFGTGAMPKVQVN